MPIAINWRLGTSEHEVSLPHPQSNNGRYESFLGYSSDSRHADDITNGNTVNVASQNDELAGRWALLVATTAMRQIADNRKGRLSNVHSIGEFTLRP